MINRLITILLIILSLFNYSCKQEETTSDFITLELDNNWQFSQAGKQDWYPATVPGCVHTDLLDNKLIEDPFFRDNEKKVQWIENEDWEYKCEFEISERLYSREFIQLVFKGIDTYAEIFLNSKPVLSADNMFREWEVDCKKYIVPGKNKLLIRFRSSAKNDLEKAKQLPYVLPDNRVFTRKAPYQSGWDWGPRLVASGIWRPVIIKAWDNLKIIDINIVQVSVFKEKANLNVVFEVQSSKEQSAELSVDIDNKHFTISSDLVPGINAISIPAEINHPRLWWCNGLGESYLYNIKCSLKADNIIYSKITKKTGIRTLELLQEPDSAGKSFYFRLNGHPVFIKGANYIPQDNFPPRVTEERYKKLIRSVTDANMNMLRVWGGGIYEEDIFYDLCNENGIMVWQDFMFACAMYPGDTAFVENVRQEAICNIKRLRNHPCIALWCGNNEVDNGWKDWGWQKQFGYSDKDSAKIWKDYQEIFHRLLPEVLAKYDPSRPYLPSSPLYGWGHKENFLEGDSHYWGVWWGQEPFEIFNTKVGRFMSEYGFQAFPDIKTIKAFTTPEDMEINSEIMLSHQKHPIGNKLINTYMERDYNIPGDFDHYIYVSQLLQAKGIIMAIEAHRRAKPYCMGTLYWQLNDCWPVISWSGIDSYGRWKALHYLVKKAYDDLLISFSEDNNNINIYCVNDKIQPVNADLSIELISFRGKEYFEKTIPVKISPGSGRIYYTLDKEKFNELNLNRVVLKATLSESGTAISENLYYFCQPKNLELTDPGIIRRIIPVNEGYRIILIAKSLAKNVYLSFDNYTGFFTDNYFDLLPGKEVTVEFLTKDGIGDPEGELKIISLVDTYNTN